jgi:4-oxalocrotonate tautomerase
MPVISWVGGKLTREQKKELIQRLTDAAVEVTRVPARFHVVIVTEHQDENLGVGGETVEELKAKQPKV